MVSASARRQGETGKSLPAACLPVRRAGRHPHPPFVPASN